MEGGQALAKRQMGNVVVEPRVEAADDVLHQIGVGDGRAEVTKPIGHCLHASAVGKDGQIALEEGSELGVEVDSPSRSVVAEDLADAAPERVGRVVIGGDGGEEVGARRL